MERRSHSKLGKMSLTSKSGSEEGELRGEWKESVCVVCFAPTKRLALRRHPTNVTTVHSEGEGMGMKGTELLTMLDALSENEGEGEGETEEGQRRLQELMNMCGECSFAVGKLEGIYRNLLHIQSNFQQLQQNIVHKIITSLPSVPSSHSSMSSGWSSWNGSGSSSSSRIAQTISSDDCNISSSFHERVFKRWSGLVSEDEMTDPLRPNIPSDIDQVSSPQPVVPDNSELDACGKNGVNENENDVVMNIVISPVQVKQEEIEFQLDAKDCRGATMRMREPDADSGSGSGEMSHLPFRSSYSSHHNLHNLHNQHESEKEGDSDKDETVEGQGMGGTSVAQLAEGTLVNAQLTQHHHPIQPIQMEDSDYFEVEMGGAGRNDEGSWESCVGVEGGEESVEGDQVYYSHQPHHGIFPHPPLVQNVESTVVMPTLSSDVTSFSSMQSQSQAMTSKSESRGSRSIRSRVSKIIKADGLDRSSDGKPVFSCKVCAQTFNHRETFKEHLANHKEKIPTCKVCEKVFPRKHNLIIHMRTHTGEKPFVCQVCGKSYADRSNLNAHVRKHVIKPFGCTVCLRMFEKSDAAHAHATQAHPQQSTEKIISISKVSIKNDKSDSSSRSYPPSRLLPILPM